MEGGEGLEVIVHVRFGQITGKALHGRVVVGMFRELDCGIGLEHRTKVRRVGDIEERDAFL